MSQQSLVRHAAAEFKKGEFVRALDLYRRLSEKLGEKYFRANIALCETRLLGQVGPEGVRSSLHSTKVACVMDEFTFHCYEPECELLPLTPNAAIEELEKFQPDLLFIESAWRGKDELWIRKIGALSRELRAVLQWCKNRQVPTVFWNKEDPVHFESFLTTAREFDFVFTTDIDCIARYKAALGHERVYLLPFACQPKIHNPIETYERKDAFCFAGAYYVRYPERTRDLENYVDQFPKFKSLEIFDRNFGKEDVNYKFPSAYEPFIVGTLPFNEIEKAYKGYRYSINLNSIKQSQTMFARRVYELLASNTLTVSNFSRGIRLLFGDLVIASDSGAEIVEQLRQLDDVAEQKLRLAALRKAMQEHTYQHRFAYVVDKALGRKFEEGLPALAVVAWAKSEQEYQSAIENYTSQNYSHKKLLIVLQGGYLPRQESIQPAASSITLLPEEAAGDLTIDTFVGDNGWLVLMACADYYGPNYLVDISLATRYSDAPLIGKVERYKFINGSINSVALGQAYRESKSISRRASAIRGNALPQGLDLPAILDAGVESSWELPGLAIDAFNYCENARQNADLWAIKSHVDDLTLNKGLPIEQLMRDAERIGPMAFDETAAPKWSPKKIHQVFGDIKHTEVSVKLESDFLRVTSKLMDDRHDYIYARSDVPVSAFLGVNGIESHLEMSPGLDIQYVFVFFNEQKDRLSHVIHAVNRNQTAAVPENAAFVRLGLRIRGNGDATIKCLILGHRKLDLARIFGRSDTLLLTNHYPTYDNLYRNGFVHSRVKSYLDRQVQVDVFRLHSVENVSYHEFQNVDVVTGNEAALCTLLDNGQYKHVLVHFLTPEMWDVLKVYPDLKVTVWVHGSEIQPWHRRDYNYQNEQDRAKAKRESDVRMEFWRSLLAPMPANMKLVFVSRYFAEEVFEDLGFRLDEDRYEIIHNPIDTDLFSYQPKAVDQRKRVLSIRPYASRKYANDLSVEAISKLSEYPCFNDMEFRMIGDGKLFDETLEPLRKFPNVTIERRFLTHPEIAALHKDYGVCLTPTRMDAQGVSRDEAMSSGLVPITSAVAAIPEFVDPSCGVLAKGEDAEGLAAGIIAIYEDPAQFAAMSEEAAARIRRQSGTRVIVSKELALFSKRENQ
jgi:glycosyltransferase involved in cell wall biosynthesis/spore maturation protein CgeB